MKAQVEPQTKRVRKYACLLAVLWTLTVAVWLTWNLNHQRRATLGAARLQALATCERLKNPAYMTGRAHELGEKQHGIRGHITGLNPMRPRNAADAWEAKALRAFESGETEVSSIEEMNGQEYMRLICPLVAKESCLVCHAAQGYQVGEVCGGTSVAVPLAPLRALALTHDMAEVLGHGLFWLLGLAGLGATTRHLCRRIREREKAEATLRDSEGRLRTVVNASKDAMIAIGPDGLITLFNPAADRMFERSASEMLGHPFDCLIPEDYREQHHELVKAYFSCEDSNAAIGRTVELPAVRSDGRRFPIELSLAAGHHGGRRFVLATIRDITRRKEAEEIERERNSLKEAVAGMEQVLGVVGHELRTPLAGLRAMSELLLTDGMRETAEADGFLQGINDEVIRMSGMVNDMLEAARLNSGTARWNWSTVALVTACQEAVDTVRPLVDEQKVTLACEVEPPEATMNGDADAVRRLVVNLLNNAAKHTQGGSINVSARGTTDIEGRWVEIRVQDSGEGVSAKAARMLGTAFALNAGVVGSKHVQGSGLGLAICKGIAAAHGGTITVESAPGEGTTVIVRLRADLSEPLAATGEAEIIRKVVA